MFGFAFFGWRKASKCKKLIKQVQCRLKLLKNKKSVITKQLREDIVQLLENGYHQTAFNRVEQIVKDETRMAAYEILDNFCEFILLNLSYIRKHKECPNDVNEAVSSLLFASARCGDLPELQLIRKLFGERYGRSFETTAVELNPGNLVNLQIKEKLSINCVSDDEKQKMMNEIVRDCLKPELLALEYRSEWHQNQVTAKEVIQVHADEKTEQQKKLAINAYETKKGDLHYSDSVTSTSCECFPQLPEERIVYLDDVVELCSSTTTEGDQRLFKFKTTPTLSNREISRENHHNQIDLVQSESWSEDENSRSKTSIEGSKKRFVVVVEGKPKKEDYKHEKSSWKQRKMDKYWTSASEITTDKEIEWANFYKKPMRRRRTKREDPPPSHDKKFTTYDGFNANINHKKAEANCRKIDVKKDGLYLRAVTMPTERPKERLKEVSFGRTKSCPYEQPSHVHPKLPDYDDIAAKFIALKRERLQNNTLKT
uniref:IST1-like protein n=1 Tax=Cucumis melo TaxID=3656 RepID=A0A9I9D5G7_CUCME